MFSPSTRNVFSFFFSANNQFFCRVPYQQREDNKMSQGVYIVLVQGKQWPENNAASREEALPHCPTGRYE